MARMGSSTRLIAVVLAVVLAAVAAWALFSYIRGLEARTQEAIEPVDAFVATDRIVAGTSAEEAVAALLIERRAIPQSAVPEGAVGDLTQIEGSVAAVDILPGEIIVAERFGEAVATTPGLGEIPQDKEAISVQVGVPEGVAAFISAGDQVSIIAQLTPPAEEVPAAEAEPEATEEPTDLPAEQPIVRYLLQDVEVLAVGRRVVQEGEDQVQQTEQVLMTLALEAAEAERLVFAYNNGSLHFTLLPPESDDPDDPSLERPIETPGRTFDTIFDD